MGIIDTISGIISSTKTNIDAQNKKFSENFTARTNTQKAYEVRKKIEEKQAEAIKTALTVIAKNHDKIINAQKVILEQAQKSAMNAKTPEEMNIANQAVSDSEITISTFEKKRDEIQSNITKP